MLEFPITPVLKCSNNAVLGYIQNPRWVEFQIVVQRPERHRSHRYLPEDGPITCNGSTGKCVGGNDGNVDEGKTDGSRSGRGTFFCLFV